MKNGFKHSVESAPRAVNRHSLSSLNSRRRGTNDWACTQCGTLLGVLRGGRVHLRFARGPEYFAGFPTTCKCTACGTLNELHSALDLLGRRVSGGATVR